jgi:hypothetical protein
VYQHRCSRAKSFCRQTLGVGTPAALVKPTQTLRARARTETRTATTDPGEMVSRAARASAAGMEAKRKNRGP